MTSLCVQDCMIPDVYCCPPQASMEQAAHLMWNGDCGILPVVDAEERLVGVVTDRDLAMAAYLCGKPLRDATVEHCMSRTVHTCLPSDSLESAIQALGQHRVRRLPVVDEQGSLVGILALNDVIRAVDELDESGARKRLSGLLLSAMAALAAPRTCDLVEPCASAATKREPQAELVKG